jgi:hypothetical protein
MAIARAAGILRYRYPNQSWVEIPADSYSLVTEQRLQQVATGRTLYGFYGQWVSNGWYPNRIDFITQGYSYCPPVLFLTPNGQPLQGVQHQWANVIWCPFAPGNFSTGRISSYGSWASVWIGYEIPEVANQLQTRCNIQVAKDGNTLTIEGVWTEGCPEVQFTPGGCPPNTIDCGDCCRPCDELNNKIRALI